MKKYKLIILLLITASSCLNAQVEENEYIPLLDTNKVWIEAMRMEFGDFSIDEYSVGDTVTHNDTLFYELYHNEGSGPSRYIHEDTTERKVYVRQFFHYPEELYYDFSMEVGEYTPYNLRLINKQVENIFGVERMVYYLQYDIERSYVIWIEGIGSLTGILDPFRGSSLLGMGDTELNCYYYNDELLYQSDFASIYGCHFEIDPDPPYLDIMWVSPDTVSLNGEIHIIVIAWDYSDFTITATFTSPNQNEYSVSDFTYWEMDYYDAYFSDFNNETGDWYLSNIRLEDEQNNVTEESYTFENSPEKFYVRKPVSINEQKNSNNFNIFPNPVNNNLFINANNIDNSEYQVEICDIFGKIIYTNQYSPINSHSKIDMSAYQAGIYLIKITNTNNQTIYTNKFIKQ